MKTKLFRYSIYFDFKNDLRREKKLQFTLCAINDFIAYKRIEEILNKHYKICLFKNEIDFVYIYKNKKLIYQGGLL